jgi:hypothetical protein
MVLQRAPFIRAAHFFDLEGFRRNSARKAPARDALPYLYSSLFAAYLL